MMRKRNKLKEKIYNAKYYLLHKEEISLHKKMYYLKNKSEIRKKKRKFYKQNKKEESKRQLLYRKNNINARIAFNLRCRISQAIRKNYKKGSAVKDLGCTVQFLKQYLEKKFKKGMNWNNYGFGKNKWHIDHIKPLKFFNLSNRKQFLLANHYSNLQPLWQTENQSKGCKYGKI